ncbi:Protein of unknown function [Anaerovirgula multivorans]|uniref:DUF2953 domain-containing protein n=1 Tax=Anaerovirgula multivorans TaxID=312168 RepID=A0A238ZVJ1_9FIRM|nr:DUF2953 domain-containing protein [Anaerovirgula multivorans]SNR87239.1 Protein of unknown function [Anaerovirgula multivorans]
MVFNYFIFAIVLLMGLIVVLSFLNIKIEVRVIREDNNDEVNVSISLLNDLLKYRMVIPFIDIFNGYNNLLKAHMHGQAEVGDDNALADHAEEKGFNLNEMKILIEKAEVLYRNYHNIISYVMKKIIISKVQWETKIGVEDAAGTAILTGALWGIKSSIILFFKNKFNLNNIYVNVTPYYVSKKFAMTFNCIVTLKIGYIINTGIKLFLIKIRGGDKFE